MTTRMKSWLDFGIALRLLVDACVLGVSLAVAFLLRYVFAIVFEGPPISAGELFSYYVSYFSFCLPLILLLGLSSFAFWGLYGRTRGYDWRNKTLTVSKAVAIPYLLLPLASFLAPESIPLPRSVFVLAFAMTWALSVLLRTWSSFWREQILQEERDLPRQPLRDPRRVLLIGGAGYIGSALLPKLLEAGYRVRLLDLFLYGQTPIQPYLSHPNLELISGDFRQVEKVVSAMKGVGSVIHLGGLVGDPACAVDEELTLDINLVATRVIAEVAKGEGVQRFIFASTCSVYGASDGLLDEQSKLNPVSLYARSKIASERVLLAARGPGFAPILLRFGTIFGLSGRTRFDLVVNLLTAKALFEGKITLYGAEQWRPFLHVDDAANSIVSVLEAPLERVDGEVFNVGADSLNYTLGQVGTLVKEMVPHAELIDYGPNADLRNYRVNFAKIRERLDFHPRWRLAEGIAQVIETIRGGHVSDYTEPQYSNVKFLSDEKIRVLGQDRGWERRVLESTGPAEEAVTSTT